VALTQDAQLGLAMRFKVVVDDIDLGGWATCKGLQVNFTNLLVNEGANYEYQTILPDRVTYPPIVLTRAMTRQDSAAVQSWLATVVTQWYNSTSPMDYSARTARITLLDSAGQEVSSWSLRSIYPRRWTGPELNAKGTEVATEVLELIHEGFL
jgi:phage tail-like protein